MGGTVVRDDTCVGRVVGSGQHVEGRLEPTVNGMKEKRGEFLFVVVVVGVRVCG